MTPRPLALALAAMVLAADAQPAAADQSDPRLYGLFARLRMVNEQADIRDITAMIWSIWYQTGRPEIDSLMLEGRRFLRNGPLHSALGNFSTITRWAPDFAEGWHKRAEVH